MPDPARFGQTARIERMIHEVPGLMAETTVDGALQRIADLAAEVVGAQYVAVGMLGPGGHTLERFVTSGIAPELHAKIGPLPTGKGILGLLIREARPIRLADLTKHPASAGFPPHHPPMRSFLGVPIVGRLGVVGELYLTEKRDAAEFTAEDEYIAILFAVIAAAAVEDARLHEQSARLLEEVQQLHRSRERFFAMVNHELRNALAAVHGWAELLVRRKGPEPVPRAAHEILDSAGQAVALISDLLDLSRLDEDRLKPVLRDAECAAVLRRSVQRMIPAANEKGVTLTPDLPADGLVIRTDAHRVEQILVNLLGNAIRHTPASRAVTARLAAAGTDVVFDIEDEGPGIPADQLERVFEIYVTGADQERAGHGLGLPLSRRLARVLGGDLTVYSAPGRGAVFTLRLPTKGPVS
jgi:signal transduction histidine kinase